MCVSVRCFFSYLLQFPPLSFYPHTLVLYACLLHVKNTLPSVERYTDGQVDRSRMHGRREKKRRKLAQHPFRGAARLANEYESSAKSVTCCAWYRTRSLLNSFVVDVDVVVD